jgi:hypothetical protein
MHARVIITKKGPITHHVFIYYVFFSPFACDIGSSAHSFLPRHFLGVIESVRGVNTSRPHGAQGDQLVFQRVVVRWQLEHATRWWCRNGICRIVLVFAPPGARATGLSGKAGKKKLILQSCGYMPYCFHTNSHQVYSCCTKQYTFIGEYSCFPISYSTFPSAADTSINATYIGATDRIPRTSQSLHSHDKHGVSVVTGTAVIIHHE